MDRRGWPVYVLWGNAFKVNGVPFPQNTGEAVDMIVKALQDHQSSKKELDELSLRAMESRVGAKDIEALVEQFLQEVK